MPIFPIDDLLQEPTAVSWLTLLIGGAILLVAEIITYFRNGKRWSWKYFGWIGGTLGWLIVILTLFPLLEGWLLSCLIIGAASYVFASLIFLLARHPRQENPEVSHQHKESRRRVSS